uniref:ABC transporter n=1 Tax=Cyberlindnera americana TaxID=36016 RepID=A0A5P8N8U3_9ASCO|nr:ABC transporter [Cyberlindnera americana]
MSSVLRLRLPTVSQFSSLRTTHLPYPGISQRYINRTFSSTTLLNRISFVTTPSIREASYLTRPSPSSHIKQNICRRLYSTPTNSNADPNQKSNEAVKTTEKDHAIETHKTKPTEQDPVDEPMGSVFKDVGKLVKLAFRDWKLLSVALSLLFVSVLVNMAMPKAYGLVLDATKHVFEGQLPDIVFGLSLYEFVSVLAVFILVGIAADYGRIIMLRILGERLVARLRSNVIKRTMSQDAEFFDVHKVGDLISRLGSDAYVVSRSMTQNISDGFKHAITGTVSITSMFLISTQLASAVFIFLPGILVGTLIFGTKVRKISRGIQEATGNLTKVGEEQLSGIKTIQSFVAEQKELAKYNSAIRRVFGLGKREAKLNATFYSSTYMMSDATFLVILAYGAQLVVSGSLSVGDLAAFMLYVNHSGSAMFGLASFYSELMKGSGAASRLFELVDRDPKINPTKGLPLREKPHGEIEFKDVCFAYPTRPKLAIFKDLSFKIPAGSNVCIVGPSGRGKSTITSLMLRYYDPLSGEILLDGKDITKYNAKSLRRHLGVVQQEPILMSGTIRDNITFGLKSSNVPEELVIEAAKKANCHDFIEKFPDGYNTIIGPRGALLSGGQKQRISIARALIKNPSVLILDEATSALDSKSEHAINLTLQKLMRDENLTSISIAHRLSTIRKADLVIVLGFDGKVAETGRFVDLYANRNSALYKLLNEDKAADTAHHDKKKHVKKDDTTSDTEEPFSDEFIKKEMIKHGLEDLTFDDSVVKNTHTEATK